ncbi:hypothetical protein BDQ17DRAFT_1435876 [Cyathus striatus]|nr:hypothetical protein BDQ17DRAFT_1435876 [Cyathus striatus]
MPGVPGYFYSSSTCCQAYAIPYVSPLRLHCSSPTVAPSTTSSSPAPPSPHTGDRPYKCQYCGDQFARSDLLSRHVNKCHANEKPLPPAPGGRRKGPASASRATTSKQACDQCVQSSLPCDGCNPCAKCVQRKCRCTFVKFHRQTAPSGPGHTAPPTLTTALSTSLGLASSSTGGTRPLMPPRFGYINSNVPTDEFVLAPPPPNMSVSAPAQDLLFTDTFGFPTMYTSSGVESDYAEKYRAQAELLRLGAGGTGTGTGVTGMYASSPVSSASTASSQDPRWASGAAWQDGYHHAQEHQQQQQQQQQIPLAGQHHSSHPNHQHHHHGNRVSSSYVYSRQ